MTLGGITATFEQFEAGISKDGKKYIWIGNRRIGYLDVEAYTWTADTTFTLENYKQVLASGTYTAKLANGSTDTNQGSDMTSGFLNSIAVTDTRNCYSDCDCCICRIRICMDEISGPQDVVCSRCRITSSAPANCIDTFAAKLRCFTSKRNVPRSLVGTYWIRIAARYIFAI